MKPSTTIALIASLGVCLVSCNETKQDKTSKQETSQGEQLSIDTLHEPAGALIKEYLAVLASIEGEAGIKAAGEKLDAVKKKCDSLVERASKLEKPPIEKIYAVSDRYGKNVQKIIGEEKGKARANLRKLKENHPGLEKEINALRRRLFKDTGPVMNIFDADGALSYPYEELKNFQPKDSEE